MQRLLRLIKLKLTTYTQIILISSLLTGCFQTMAAQQDKTDPAQAIQELHDGWLIVRLPSYRAKIDTLEALSKRAVSPEQRKRFEMLAQEARNDRDSIQHGYISAFQQVYSFSKVAFYQDYQARDYASAVFTTPEGQTMTYQELSTQPHAFLFFERTQESKIDALVAYDSNFNRIPSPFPNNFSRGGFQFLFIKLSDTKFPVWRISKINKKWFDYFQYVRVEAIRK